VSQRNANVRLRQELTQLREEHVQVDRLREDNERLQKENQILANLKIDHDEMERLRRQNEELLRLRGQVGVAKAAQAENARQLQEARSQLNESLQRAANLGETNVGCVEEFGGEKGERDARLGPQSGAS
jgi:hypothetical protein